MCSALLKNYEIPIFNAAMTIKTIVSVKYFQSNLPIIFSKRSMFAFIIIKPITKFSFRFPNVVDSTTNFYILIYRELFRNHMLRDHSEF